MIIIAGGSNLRFEGLRSRNVLLHAFRAVGRVSCEISFSHFYQSLAWPDPSDPPFINAAVRIETALSPIALLSMLHCIEEAFGRRRSERNAPRSLDLDLIAYNDVRLSPDHESALALPHPRAHQRAFVLRPIVDIAPDWRHPILNKTAAELLAAIDQSGVLPLADDV